MVCGIWTSHHKISRYCKWGNKLGPGYRSFVSLECESKLRRLKAGMTLTGADAHNPEYIGKKVGFTDSISKEPAFFRRTYLDHSPSRSSHQPPPCKWAWKRTQPRPPDWKRQTPSLNCKRCRSRGTPLRPSQLPARFEFALGGRHRKWKDSLFLLQQRACLDHNERDPLLGKCHGLGRRMKADKELGRDDLIYTLMAQKEDAFFQVEKKYEKTAP